MKRKTVTAKEIRENALDGLFTTRSDERLLQIAADYGVKSIPDAMRLGAFHIAADLLLGTTETLQKSEFKPRSKPPIERDWSTTIWFDDLMDCIKYVPSVLNKPYMLRFNGEIHTFADTKEVIPFVKKHFGYTVLDNHSEQEL